MKKLSIILGVFLVVWLVVSALSCAAEAEVDISQVRSYADPMTENILSAMNDNNFIKYSENFDDAMQNALTEAIFQQQNSLIKAKIGDYTAKEFWEIEIESQFTIVYYKAKFTKEPADVTVKVVFQEIAKEMYVSGLWFDSPNLRK